MTAPISLRAVIACARALEVKQGFGRRRAIAAALKIVAKNPGYKPARKSSAGTARSEAALEYLQHRARSLRAWRPA